MFAGASAQAQVVITWGAATAITTDTNVDTNGTLLYAYDAYSSGASDMVNGVTFVGKNDSAAGFSSSFVGDNSIGGAPTNGGYSGSANFTTLLTASWYANAGAATGTLTLSGLTAGQIYEIQLFDSDGRRAAGTYDSTYAATNSVTLSAGSGQYVIGDFTATASTEVVNTSALAGSDMQVSAYELRDEGVAAAPEPSTYALTGLGALALLVISRRRRTA